MKLRISIIVLLISFLSLQNLFGQTIAISSPATTDVCNAKQYVYSAITSGLNPKKSYYANWIVSTGAYTEGTISGAKVTWEATTSSNIGTLKVELKDAANNNVVATSNELSFTIKSIKHIKAQLPMFGGGGGVYTLSPCEAGTLYLSAADIQVPGTGNPPQEVSSWKWLVPSGWTVDGQTSNGSTMILGNQDVIVTYPASATEGSIKVQGKHDVNGCTTENQESLISDPVSVKREISFTLSANKTHVLCGETNPVTFTVSPAPSCAVYYWNNSQTPSTNNSFQVTPSGTSDVIATVTIVYGGKQAIKSKTISNLLFAPGVVPVIQGSDKLCGSNESYTVSNIRPGYTVSWSCSSNLSRISAPVSYPGIFNFTNSGAGWIEATISSPCGDWPVSLHKDVWVGTPQNNKVSATVRMGPSDNQLCMNTEMAIAAGHSEASLQGITQFVWDFGDWAPYFQYYDISPGPQNAVPVFNLPDNAPISQLIRIYAANSCGYNSYYFSKTFYARNCGGYYLLVSPSPSSGESTVSLLSENNDATQLITEWDLDIYDSTQGLKEKKTRLKTPETKINTSVWKDGVYIVRAKVGDKIVIEKLIVKH